MSIILVDCLARGSGKRYSTIDVIGPGPRLILSILKRGNIEAELYTFEEIAKKPRILEHFPILMISGMSSDIRASLKVLKLWKKYSKRKLVSIVGGPIAVEYKELIRMGYDLVVYGEAEKTLEELIEKGVFENRITYDSVKNVKGIAYRANSKIIFNGPREWLTRYELSMYKPDTESITKYELCWAARVYVEVVRGCSNFRRPTILSMTNKQCSKCNICTNAPLERRIHCPMQIPPGCGYCSVPAIFGPARSRSKEVIYQEIKELINLGVNRIVLSAPDILDYGRDILVEPKPLTDPRHPPPNITALKSLFETLWSIPEVSSGEVTIMVENVKPCLVTEDSAKILGEYLKDTPIYIGLETGHEEHHIAIGRPSTVSEAIKAIKLLKKEGLRPYVYLIHGLPGENEETITATINIIDTLRSLGVEKIILYRFTPLKGSAFENAPKPPPAVLNFHTKKLYDKVIEFNTTQKKKFIGKTLRTFIVARYPKDRSYLVSYPQKHGPVILIKERKNLIGYLAEVKVTKIISDRLVEGIIIRIIKKCKRR